MKNKVFAFFGFMMSILVSAQVSLVEVKKVHENSDKFLYKIDSAQTQKAEYLGKLEVNGFELDDVAVFNEVYKKAKSTGANAYHLQLKPTIEGKPVFNPSFYSLLLYFIDEKQYGKEENQIYLISSSEKAIKVRINNQKILLEPRSFIKLNLNQIHEADIAVGGFLGSRIQLKQQSNQPNQYFQISGAKISTNSYGEGGLNLKSGDFITLEKSFAQFLLTIYQEKRF